MSTIIFMVFENFLVIFFTFLLTKGVFGEQAPKQPLSDQGKTYTNRPSLTDNTSDSSRFRTKKSNGPVS